MKILLIQPEGQTGKIGFRLAALPEPLALELLATAAGDAHEIRILDMRLEGNLAAVLQDFVPEMVAVTALTTEVYAAQNVLAEVKAFNKDIFTLVGGHHASLLPEDFFLSQVDAVSIGEGELSFPFLLEALGHGRELSTVPSLMYRRPDGSFAKSTADPGKVKMDCLGLPRRDLTAKYRSEYFFLFDKPDTSVATGRGCPYRCNFCSVWTFYNGQTSQMTPQRVLQEIEAAGTDHITFVDDNFLMNNKREDAIADLVRSSGIRKRFSMECRTDSIVRHPELVTKWVDVGLYAVLLGLEGANDKALKNVNKNNTSSNNDEAIRILKDHGVIIWGAFLVDPQWEEDDFRCLRDYVNAKEITHTQFTVLTPLPGTDLFARMFPELLTYDYGCYDALHAVTATKLPREKFYQCFANLYRQRDLGPYLDLVREGKLSIEDCKRGKGMLDAMAQWELYLENDPVLGKCRDKSQISGGLKRFLKA